MSKVDLNWLQQQFPELQSITPLGPGGQKIVLAANHPEEGNVVLKLYRLGEDEEVVLREVAAPELIASHRVPNVFGAGKISSPLGEVLWLRERRITGLNLRQTLQNGPLDPASVLRLSVQMLEALAAAEKARIVHRDVKPENIIVASDRNFWLIDFGLARHLDLASMTATALAWGKGTPGYMPPEQWRNVKRDIDARADIFGLGVTLYECAEGANPFRIGARDELEMLRRSERESLAPIRTQIDAAGQFSELVLAMTRVDLVHRIPTAKEALEWAREIYHAEGYDQ